MALLYVVGHGSDSVQRVYFVIGSSNNETRPCFTDPSGMGTPTEDDELATERWGLVTVQKMKDALEGRHEWFLRHLF